MAIEEAIPLSAGQYDTTVRDEGSVKRISELEAREGADGAEAIAPNWRLQLGTGAEVTIEETTQCHHNYTEQMSDEQLRQWKSRPKGRTGHVWLSRKCAIDASAGRPGLIPGSMGTRSYVVTGKGNALSLNSSPHGAGREYSRAKARRLFTRDQLDTAMAGIEWRPTDAVLDEIPAAYKGIDRVMADAADLVEIRHALRQIVNVKGD